ncbi:MAG: CinA family protein, partial [Pirellulales bacterium]
TVATIHRCLGRLVFGEEEDELQHAVLRLLDRRQGTVATVEWGTAGQIAIWLDEADPQGDRYLGGVVVRSSHVADSLLGGDRPVAHGEDVAGARELARHLSIGCRERTGADYGLATSPLSDTRAKGDHSFAVAVATSEEVVVRSFPAAPHPSLRRVLRAKQGLNMLRLQLLAEA